MNDQAGIDHLIKSIVDGVSVEHLETECKGLNLNEVGMHGRTPLMMAAVVGSLAAVKTLVRNGASVHVTGRSRMTALHEAAVIGEARIVNYLLSHGAKIDAETVDGVTPLMSAAAFGNLEVVRLLLENGADHTKTDNRGATAADGAREKCEDDAADLIDLYAKR